MLEQKPIVVKTWFKKGYSRRISFDRKVTRLLKKNNYDLVFGHGDNFQQDILFPHNCVHLAHELVQGSPLNSNDSVGRIHERLFQNGTFKHIIANSYLMKNDLIERFNIEADIIDVVHPGFSSKQFDFSQKQKWREEKRAEFNVSEDQCLVGLITSGVFDKRNLDLFIRSIAALNPSVREKCKFIVLGKDPKVSLTIKNLLKA